MVKRAVAVLPLESVAVQVTSVRPISKALPEAGSHAAGTGPSTASLARTTYFTRAERLPLGMRRVFADAPANVGGLRSKVVAGASSVPVIMSEPCVYGTPTLRSVPLPDAPAYDPVPPVTV